MSYMLALAKEDRKLDLIHHGQQLTVGQIVWTFKIEAAGPAARTQSVLSARSSHGQPYETELDLRFLGGKACFEVGSVVHCFYGDEIEHVRIENDDERFEIGNPIADGVFREFIQVPKPAAEKL